MALDAFALILLTLGLGLLFARLRVLPENSADVLNRVVLYLCLPAAPGSVPACSRMAQSTRS